MYNRILILAVTLSVGFTACQKQDFEDAYTDPSKISVSSVEKQFAGFLQTNREFVVPSYWNYFVINRITLNRYTQSVGWVNVENQYVPGSAAISDRWNNFYGFVSQYREIEKIYNTLSDVDKADRKIYMIAATTYLYDHTAKVIDLHGDIPFSEAGKLSTNGGDYAKSYPKYDKAEDLYKKMLDDLKTFADELNTMTVKNGIQTGFKTQDFILKGDMAAWKRYVNSLRLRMLSRVSGTSTLSARAKTEIGEILSNTAKYPIVSSNAENIQINIFDLNTNINSKGFQSGLEDWNGNVAGKKMIDLMNSTKDPRQRFIFEPGTEAKGIYEGLDHMAVSAVQTEKIASNKMSIYNRSTISRNQYFPGILITASEVQLLASEYYLAANDPTKAKVSYENGVKQSIEFYAKLRGLSNDNTVAVPAAVTDSETMAYLKAADISWDNNTNKIGLIATQKWLHFNVIQPVENWSELRRLDGVSLNFWVDNSNNQKTPPVRWYYPGSEQTYNTENYSAVKGSDNLTTRIFWDIK